MLKYKQIFKEMIRQNQELFDSFQKTHDKYCFEPKAWKEKFNQEGGKVMMVIKRYENRLCGKSEGSGFGMFTGGLSEKFWQEVRKHFPKIDEVGLIG